MLSLARQPHTGTAYLPPWAAWLAEALRIPIHAVGCALQLLKQHAGPRLGQALQRTQLVDARLHHLLSVAEDVCTAEWTAQWQVAVTLVSRVALFLVTVATQQRPGGAAGELWPLAGRRNTLALLTAGTLHLLRAKHEGQTCGGRAASSGQLGAHEWAVASIAVAQLNFAKLVLSQSRSTSLQLMCTVMEGLNAALAAFRPLAAAAAAGGPEGTQAASWLSDIGVPALLLLIDPQNQPWQAARSTADDPEAVLHLTESCAQAGEVAMRVAADLLRAVTWHPPQGMSCERVIQLPSKFLFLAQLLARTSAIMLREDEGCIRTLEDLCPREDLLSAAAALFKQALCLACLEASQDLLVAVCGTFRALEPQADLTTQVNHLKEASREQLRSRHIWGRTAEPGALLPMLYGWARLLASCGQDAVQVSDEDEPQLEEELVHASRPCANLLCTNVRGCSEGRLRGRRCGGCGVVRYCSKECQLQHWAQHGHVCAALAAQEEDKG
ncbi:hypothetical protein N2152v2_002560 [Parachlorella kessleri]